MLSVVIQNVSRRLLMGTIKISRQVIYRVFSNDKAINFSPDVMTHLQPAGLRLTRIQSTKFGAEFFTGCLKFGYFLQDSPRRSLHITSQHKTSSAQKFDRWSHL